MRIFILTFLADYPDYSAGEIKKMLANYYDLRESEIQLIELETRKDEI